MVLDVGLSRHPIGQPDRDAIQQQHIRQCSCASHGQRKIEWFFNRLPSNGAGRPVLGDALAHFIVAGSGGRDESDAATARGCQSLRKGALAAARAA